MVRWHWLAGFCALLIVLSACGTPAATAPADVPASGMSNDGAAATAQYMIDALATQDTATVMRLADPQMPMRDLAVGGELQQWKDRTRVPKSYFYPAIGPLVRTELQPAEQRGATTAIRAVLHHELGDAEMTIELHETAEGWRVLGLKSRVTSHPTPTAKP